MAEKSSSWTKRTAFLSAALMLTSGHVPVDEELKPFEDLESRPDSVLIGAPVSTGEASPRPEIIRSIFKPRVILPEDQVISAVDVSDALQACVTSPRVFCHRDNGGDYYRSCFSGFGVDGMPLSFSTTHSDATGLYTLNLYYGFDYTNEFLVHEEYEFYIDDPETQDQLDDLCAYIKQTVSTAMTLESGKDLICGNLDEEDCEEKLGWMSTHGDPLKSVYQNAEKIHETFSDEEAYIVKDAMTVKVDVPGENFDSYLFIVTSADEYGTIQVNEYKVWERGVSTGKLHLKLHDEKSYIDRVNELLEQ